MRGDGDNQPPCGVAEPVSEKESHLELYLIPTRKTIHGIRKSHSDRYSVGINYGSAPRQGAKQRLRFAAAEKYSTAPTDCPIRNHGCFLKERTCGLGNPRPRSDLICRASMGGAKRTWTD
jgi:hypothetical protein